MYAYASPVHIIIDLFMIFLVGAFSPLSSLGDIGRMLISVPGVFTSNSANGSADETESKDDNDEIANQNTRYLILYCYKVILINECQVKSLDCERIFG